MIWLSEKRDFFTGLYSEKATRKFRFPSQLIHGDYPSKERIAAVG